MLNVPSAKQPRARATVRFLISNQVDALSPDHSRRIVKRGYRRWLFPRDQRDAPGIVSLLLRIAMVSSDAQTKMSRLHSDLPLEPPMQDIDVRDWGALDRAIDAAYRFAAKNLQDGGDVLYVLKS